MFFFWSFCLLDCVRPIRSQESLVRAAFADKIQVRDQQIGPPLCRKARELGRRGWGLPPVLTLSCTHPQTHSCLTTPAPSPTAQHVCPQRVCPQGQSPRKVAHKAEKRVCQSWKIWSGSSQWAVFLGCSFQLPSSSPRPGGLVLRACVVGMHHKENNFFLFL